ncbi:MAG: PorV/PorQ family protein [Bacteroidales bacterium]|nr:PorV/PorQ family protein [Bacteroidales bacterium]
MKRILSILTVIVLTTLLSTPRAMAGNDDRRGTAGAAELLINPWARSSGWGGINNANGRGIDAFFSNIAGLSFVEKTEFAYTNTMWLGGKSGMLSAASINAFGLAIRLGDAGVLGAYVMSMGFGDIDRTEVGSPEAGSNGTFSPTLMNLNVGFAYSFSTAIHGGANIKVISESTDNVTATGVAIDAGIQYLTGENDEFKFGISLKNIGPALSFSGTGMSFTTINDAGNPMTVEFRSAEMELPTCLNIGASYDFMFEKWNQRLTIAANFTSNAFLRDYYGLGFEYSLLDDRFMARAAYVYQAGLLQDADRATANAGLSAGASVNIPLKKDGGPSFSIDYAYRSAYNMKGSHSIGATIKF